MEEQLKSIIQYVESHIDMNDSFSVFYVSHVFEQVQGLVAEKKQCLKELQGELQDVEQQIKNYSLSLAAYNKQFKNSKVYFKEKRVVEHVYDEQDDPSKHKLSVQAADWKENKFQTFVMQTSSYQTYEKNSQVYFPYSRAPN